MPGARRIFRRRVGIPIIWSANFEHKKYTDYIMAKGTMHVSHEEFVNLADLDAGFSTLEDELASSPLCTVNH